MPSRHRRSSSKQQQQQQPSSSSSSNNNSSSSKKKEKRKKSIFDPSDSSIHSSSSNTNTTTTTTTNTTVAATVSIETVSTTNTTSRDPSSSSSSYGVTTTHSSSSMEENRMSQSSSSPPQQQHTTSSNTHPRIPLLWTKTPPSSSPQQQLSSSVVNSKNNSTTTTSPPPFHNKSYELNSTMTTTTTTSNTMSSNVTSSPHSHVMENHSSSSHNFDPTNIQNNLTMNRSNKITHDQDEDAQLMEVVGEFPTLSFCDLMLLGSSTTGTTPNLDVKNHSSPLADNFHQPSSPSSSSRKHFHSTSNSTGSINLSLTSFGKENMVTSPGISSAFSHSTMKTMSPLAPSAMNSSTLVTKPLSLDISKLKPKSNNSPSSCVTPEFTNEDTCSNIRLTTSNEKKSSKYRERSLSFGSKKAASASGSLSHRAFNVSSSSSAGRDHISSSSQNNSSTTRMKQGMSFSKWTELIQNNGAFARINNLSSSNHSSPSNSPNMLHPGGDNTTDDSNMSAGGMSSHDSSDIFDQLEDILSYQHPTSPRYRTYSKSENVHHEHVTTGDTSTTEIGNSQSLDLQYALIGSRGGTRKIEDWMKRDHLELRKSEIPSLRESRASTESRKGVPNRLTSKSRTSFNSKSAIDLNAKKFVKKTPSIVDDIDSEKSSSFSEGDSPSFRPRRKKRSESHIVVNASVCLHFSIDK